MVDEASNAHRSQILVKQDQSRVRRQRFVARRQLERQKSVTLASHPPGESSKSANARHLLQNMSLNRVEDFFIADVGLEFSRTIPQGDAESMQTSCAAMNASKPDGATAPTYRQLSGYPTKSRFAKTDLSLLPLR